MNEGASGGMKLHILVYFTYAAVHSVAKNVRHVTLFTGGCVIVEKLRTAILHCNTMT